MTPSNEESLALGYEVTLARAEQAERERDAAQASCEAWRQRWSGTATALRDFLATQPAHPKIAETIWALDGELAEVRAFRRDALEPYRDAVKRALPAWTWDDPDHDPLFAHPVEQLVGTLCVQVSEARALAVKYVEGAIHATRTGRPQEVYLPDVDALAKLSALRGPVTP